MGERQVFAGIHKILDRGIVFGGASGWDRTSNPCLRRAVLYPLSYGREDGDSSSARDAFPRRQLAAI